MTTAATGRRTLQRRAVLLLVGDLAALVTFAILGRRSHDEATGLAAVGAVLETALPFLVGWLIAALLLRATDEDRTASVSGIASRTVVTWAGAFPIAVVIRAMVLGRFSPLSFYIVAFTVALAMLIAWRIGFVLLERRFSSRSS